MIHYSTYTLLITIISTALHAQPPCPCNLVTDTCEPNCCCDADCNSEYSRDLAFCSTTPVVMDTLRSFRFQFLAVSRDNSAILGLFYPNPANITSDLFDSLVSQHLPFQPPAPTFPASLPHYRYGDPLLATTDSITHYLSFTTTSLFGECVLSPVSYLHNAQVTCTSDRLSPSTQTSVSSRYLCARYTDWVAVYTPHSPQNIVLSSTIQFSNCSTDIPSCLNSVTCPHLLLSTHTLISWYQGRLLHIQEEIRLLMLPPNTSATPLIIQSHAISYQYTSNDTVHPSYDLAADENLLPGYLRGVDLLFGVQESGSGYIRPSSGSLITSSSGLCSTISLRNVEFQYNSISGCILHVPSNYNCSQIRRGLLDLFDQLLPATHVARSRRSSQLYPEHWVPLLRPSPPDTPSNASLCSLPTHLLTRYLYSHAGRVGSYQILEITGAIAQLEYHQVEFMHTNGEFRMTVSTSTEFIQVPASATAPTPRSHIRHTPVCQEPCYAPDQLFYPLYQSMSLQGLESSLSRFLSHPSLSDGFYFAFLLSLSVLFIFYRIVNSILF